MGPLVQCGPPGLPGGPVSSMWSSTWQSKQEKEACYQPSHRDGIVTVAQPVEIPVHHNRYNALTIIQDTNPLVNIPFGSRRSLRPHKWSVAVLQFQRAQLGKQYKRTTKLKHKVLRAIRKQNLTNLRVIESYHNNSLHATSSTSDHHQTLEETTSPMLATVCCQHVTILHIKDKPTTVPPSDSDSDSSDSDNSLTIHEKSYIRPDMNESSSESAA